MNRHILRSVNPLHVIVAAILGIGLVAALVLPHLLRDGSGSDSGSGGHGTHGAATASSYTFKASTNGHDGMLHWTVEGSRITGCYTEVTTSDYSGNRGADTEPFRGTQDGDQVRLDGLLQDGGSVKGTLRGDGLSLSDTFGPVETYHWHSTTEQQFWKDAPGGDSGPKPTC